MNFKQGLKSISAKDELRVEITPLIDVVFLLLIFFTITTTFVTTPGFRVKLPKASSSTPQKQKDQATLVITKEGEIIFGHRQIGKKELADELSELAARSPDVTLIVQAHESVPHGKVVEMMDIAKESGIKQLAIATRAKM